jgi:hypothetical protein
VGVAGAWWPRGKRALALVGTRRALANGEREQGSGTEAGRAVFGRGPGSEAAAREREKYIFQLYFQGIFKCPLSNIILSKKKTFSGNDPKIKVA